MADIYINYGIDLQEMTFELMDAAKVADKLDPTMKVGIKPNLVVSRSADDGATTHPEIVEGIIKYLQAFGIHDITILEGSWIGDNTKRAFKNCGYTDLAEKYGVKLLDTKEDKVVKIKNKNVLLNVCESALNVDYLINVPVLKGHCQTGMTCCLKNLKGCIPDSEKRRFHTMGLDNPIAVLGTVLRPSLNIIDSVCGDLSFEEGGNPVTANRIILGFDPVLLDSYGAQLMGFGPDDIGYLRIAKNYGAGKYADIDTDILELNSENRPKTITQHSSAVKRLSGYIEADSACSACYAALIYALDKTGGIKDEKIKIGQGYKGKTLSGPGVGNCTAGCGSYVKGCPPKASDIVDMIKNWR
ncbi:uncharacterized protein (DUF362 family) [Mobilisporobacter senegalensis]|uniref:Uncharacterized protein (DUF362 family) n=1 Tax=Mobilisporobacter senegalensis TaxID=1329262 RepID=A0A3N1XNN9_9FIRM|nr:DUF362 domain-containing protein [Mobilisporobacter senegalensis]ROR26347.1 uncharacterized protein (DUF362 family) [Mobilisporobacter senegalensis]